VQQLQEREGVVTTEPSASSTSTCLQWPARRKHGRKIAEEEEQKERKAEKKTRKRQAG
jgi:hypothetical protein